jgi:Na+-translocating ferredoxin:NAD+ oxidoreductase subunit B
MLTDILQLIQFPDFFHFFVPCAGVGGGVEAKEYVPLAPLIQYTLIFLAAIGTLFGLALALAAKKFSVTIDPKVEEVKEVLAHAH